MPDEPSLGEVARTVERLDRQWAAEVARIRAEHAADIQRVEREHDANIQRLEREHTEDLRKLRSDVIRPLQERMAAAEKRPALTTGRWAGVALAVIALAALLVQAYGTLKGAK